MRKKVRRTKKLNLVSSSIRDQIEIERDSLIKDPNFNVFNRFKIHDLLQKEAEKHSVAMEFPSGKKRGKYAMIRLTKEGLNSAFRYFTSVYKGELNPELIKETASLIEEFNSRGYRTTTARAQGVMMIYPRPEKIASEIERVCNENNTLEYPIDKALHSHFHLSRIHPFSDGNGRLARIIQNGILDTENLPPIILTSEDRRQYVGLINEAQVEYKENEGLLKPKQARFFNYLALKLRDSLVQAKNNLRQGKYK